MPTGSSYPDLIAIPDSAEFVVFAAPGTRNIRWQDLKTLLRRSGAIGMYRGEFNPVQGYPVASGLTGGDYFVANNTGISAGVSYAPGDWAVWNGGAWIRQRHNFGTGTSGAFRYRGPLNAVNGVPPSPVAQDVWLITGDGTFGGIDWTAGTTPCTTAPPGRLSPRPEAQ